MKLFTGLAYATSAQLSFPVSTSVTAKKDLRIKYKSGKIQNKKIRANMQNPIHNDMTT
jgi:hypothetical protein